MAGYDGSIRINTGIKTKNAYVQLAALENRIVKTVDKISALRSKMDVLKDAKVPTQEYQEISVQIEKAEQRLNRLLERQEQMQREGKDNGVPWQRLNDQIEEVKNEIQYAKGELQDLVDTGKAFTLGSDTEAFAKLGQQLQYAENDLSVLTQRHEGLERKQEQAADGYKKLAATAKSAFESIGRILKKANSIVNSFGKKIKEIAQKHLPFFRKETEKTKSTLSGFGARLRSLALSLLLFNQISRLFSAAAGGIKEGFENLYEENERFQNVVNNLRASLLTLKNALAGAFAPIVEVAIPYIQKLIEYMTDAVNLIGQFIAALTGKKTYTKAIRQTAAAFEDAAEATEEETKALNKQLSPLDKLNNLTSQKEKDADKETGSGSGSGIMFEEVPIDSSILDMADKVKDVLSKLFAPLKKAWDREGKFVMDSWKYALDEVWKLIKDIGRDFMEVWQQEKTVKIFEDLLHIIGDIGLIIGHLARNFRDAWNENKTGLHILENIRDIIGVIVHNIRLAADKTVEWADKLNFRPLLEAFERFTESLIPVMDNLSGILTDFYVQVLLPLAKWTIEKGLPELLDVFTAFNEKVDWVALRENLSEFWGHLEPFAETVGEGLIIFIERIADALADFLNSQEFKDFLVMVENWMDSVSPGDVADALQWIAEGLIGLKLALLGYSAIKGIAGVFTTIKTFLSFFGVGGAGATVAGGIGNATAALEGLSGALGGLAIVGASYFGLDQLTEHLVEIAGATGHSTDQAKRLEERYDGLDGKLTGLSDGFHMIKNGIEGYGFAADNCVGTGIVLEKAMEDIANGAILTDQHMAELQNRFSLTDEDMEMLRQEMLDANPLLREFADNLGFEDASAETLQDIAEGFGSIANGVDPLPEEMFNMTEEARNFINQVREADDPMEVYGEKLANIGSIAENASGKLNMVGENISAGVTKGMEEADVDTASQSFFSRIVDSIKNVFGIHSPAENMKPLGENIILGVAEGFIENIEQFSAAIQSWFDESVKPWFTKEKWSELWENVKASSIERFQEIGLNITQNLGDMQTNIKSRLDVIRTNFANVFNGIKSTVLNIFNSIKSSISNVLNGISQKISSLTNSMRGIGGGAYKSNMERVQRMSSAAMPYVVNPVAASLQNVEFPAYATGQVIPRKMREHLAILGDNSRETEVVSPLSTIKQALREEARSLGLDGGNSGQDIYLNLTVECEGLKLLHILQKLDREYFKQHGKHALT